MTAGAARWRAGVVVGFVGATVELLGCGVPQAEACRVYVACQAAIDPSVDTTDQDEGGRCWALPDTARQCEARCEAALEALRATPAPPPPCDAGAADG